MSEAKSIGRGRMGVRSVKTSDFENNFCQPCVSSNSPSFSVLVNPGSTLFQSLSLNMALPLGNSFKHIIDVDPQSCWQGGLMGFLLRYRGFVTTATFKGAIAAGAFYEGWIELGFAILLIAVFLFTWLYQARTAFLRERNADLRLHSCFHNLRDIVPEIISPRASMEITARKFDELNRQVVQDIASYFRARFQDASICCALRLGDNSSGQLKYVTKARSDGMDPNRKSLSDPIPSDKGLASVLRSQESRGILLIPSIKDAIERGAWMETRTDKLTDVKSLVVAPINGIEEGERAMMGILYVTTTNSPFQPHHAIQLRAFSDALGLVYSTIALNLSSRVVEKKPEQSIRRRS